MIEPCTIDGNNARACSRVLRGTFFRLGLAYALGAMLAVVPLMPVLADGGEPMPREQPSTSIASESRYIVYLDEASAARFADESVRPAMLAEWESRLSGKVRVERRLATGGWVLTVRGQSPASRYSVLQSLEGVTAVEADALMRRF